MEETTSELEQLRAMTNEEEDLADLETGLQDLEKNLQRKKAQHTEIMDELDKCLRDSRKLEQLLTSPTEDNSVFGDQEESLALLEHSEKVQGDLEQLKNEVDNLYP